MFIHGGHYEFSTELSGHISGNSRAFSYSRYYEVREKQENTNLGNFDIFDIFCFSDLVNHIRPHRRKIL
jgi:hypothetical protein